MLKLSLRLQAVASFVPANSIVADIGTDHGLLPIYLVQNNIAQKAYAIDNKQKPLLSTQQNIKLYNSECVIPLLSNGLEQLPPDCDTLVLAGLGSATIIEILQANPQKLASIQAIIIQANVGIESIRKWAYLSDWTVEDETMVKDNNIIYDIVKLKPGKYYLSEDEILFGPILLKEKNALFVEKWTNLLVYLENMYVSIPSGNDKKKYYHELIEKIKNNLA